MASSRPQRKLVSRLISVGGHQVLRSNNYDLEEGERSVWQQELDEDGRAVSKPTTVTSRAPPKAVPKRKSPQKTKVLSEAEKQRSVALAQRKAHNDSIKSDKSDKQTRRSHFIHQNWHLVRICKTTPFTCVSKH
jgi:hypothetical protein